MSTPARVMRAMQIFEYGPASALRMVEGISVPMPASKQILVSVKAAGVNPVDTYIRSGTNNYTTKFPHTPGRDGSGVIAAIGADTEGFSKGMRVYFSSCLTGSAAEYTLCDVGHVYPLPDTVTFNEGACIGVPYLTAHRALFGRAQAKEGQRVLVHGASGGVGTACVQLCVAKNLHVVGTAGSDDGIALVRAQHPSVECVDHRVADHLSGFGGFDVIVEMLANVNLAQDCAALAKGGTVAVVGSRGVAEGLNPRDLMSRDAAVVGVALANCSDKDRKAITEDLHPLLESGTLKPVVRAVYSLEQLGRAHDDVVQPGAQGNVVVGLS